MLVSCQAISFHPETYGSLSCRCFTLKQMIQCTHGFKTSACTCHTHTHVFVHTHVHACTHTHRGPIQLSGVSVASWSTCEHPTRWSLQRALGLASMGGSSQLCMSDTSLETRPRRAAWCILFAIANCGLHTASNVSKQSLFTLWKPSVVLFRLAIVASTMVFCRLCCAEVKQNHSNSLFSPPLKIDLLGRLSR